MNQKDNTMGSDGPFLKHTCKEDKIQCDKCGSGNEETLQNWIQGVSSIFYIVPAKLSTDFHYGNSKITAS